MVEIIEPKTLLYFMLKEKSFVSIESIRNIADTVAQKTDYIFVLDRDSFVRTQRRYPYLLTMDDSGFTRKDNPNFFPKCLSKEFYHGDKNVNLAIEKAVSDYYSINS